MPKTKSNPEVSLRLSDKRIAEVHQHLKNIVAGIMRLQRQGKLPYAKPVPITVIRITDIMLILERKRRTSERIMSELRTKLGKKEGQELTIAEFCREKGLDEPTVQHTLMMCTVNGLR